MKKLKFENIEILRESTGINEVDKMISGGFPKNSIIGLSGPPGVGKSIFALHFLLEGARKGEKSVYINLEEPLKNIYNMINQFDFSKEFFNFVKDDVIVIRCFEYLEYEKIYSDFFEKINENKSIKRLVIDTFNCYFGSLSVKESLDNGLDSNIYKMISLSFSVFRNNEITTLLILENGFFKNRSFNILHLVDGIINLDFLDFGTIERRIFIPKMRWTDQFKDSKNFDIGKKGIEISNEE